ncbi:MAG: peptidyl-prolyl cis-trans isomerase [Desulfuromonadales bacterium]|nr:peptidyl-prolyl cis-trans isomerase [Desulfuromonadales bacterium]
MRRIFPILMLLACTTTLMPASSAEAWLFGNDDTLVTMDGTSYSNEDFKRWWRFWNDGGDSLPKTVDPYVDWLLLVREGKRMELAADPSFERQTRVFLQSRTLLMLKYDAVDSQIKITDADLYSRYEKIYTPQWLIERLHFKDEETAAAAWQQLKDGLLTVEQLLVLETETGGPASRQETWLRPSGIDPGWIGIFEKLSVGEIADPEQHKGGVVLYHMKDQKGGDDDDFAKLQEMVRREIWKEQENALTSQLLKDLQAKYEVKVEEERIEALDLNAPEDSFTDAILISTNRQNVTEKDFMIIAHRDMAQRPDAAHASFDAEKARELKSRVVAGIIAQSVTNWESLDRHYEQKEPFKWEYDFNVAHRLTLALTQRLFTPQATVTEAEIRQHFEENLSRYSQPAMVKLYIIDDTQGEVDQLWADVVSRKDFPKAVREKLGRSIPPQEVPANHLDPAIKAVIDKLAAGETSSPFTAQGSRVIVHLISRTPEEPLPMERVAGSIRTKLIQEKVDQQRQAYLELLKSRSKIKVRDRQWHAVKKELGGAG